MSCQKDMSRLPRQGSVMHQTQLSEKTQEQLTSGSLLVSEGNQMSTTTLKDGISMYVRDHTRATTSKVLDAFQHEPESEVRCVLIQMLLSGQLFNDWDGRLSISQ